MIYPTGSINQAAILQNRILDEIAVTLGFPRDRHFGRLIAPLFWLPARHFSKIAARFDEEVARGGLSSGSRLVLPDFSMEVKAFGCEGIPKEGPVLIVSNHPGAYDSIGIMASIPRRDLTIVLSDVPFIRALSAASQHFIFIPEETNGRMAALRASIRTLKSGGALLIFAHGQVEPDPAFMAGAEESFQDWSRSIEIMLRKVPDAWLQLCVISHVLLPAFINNPITRIRRQPFARQKLGEVLQVVVQMMLPHRVNVYPKITFDKPIGPGVLAREQMMPAIIQRARNLLYVHLSHTMAVQSASEPCQP